LARRAALHGFAIIGTAAVAAAWLGL